MIDEKRQLEGSIEVYMQDILMGKVIVTCNITDYKKITSKNFYEVTCDLQLSYYNTIIIKDVVFIADYLYRHTKLKKDLTIKRLNGYTFTIPAGIKYKNNSINILFDIEDCGKSGHYECHDWLSRPKKVEVSHMNKIKCTDCGKVIAATDPTGMKYPKYFPAEYNDMKFKCMDCAELHNISS